MMAEITLWEVIKKSYSNNFNIPSDVLEYYANLEILKRCVFGYSTSRIAFSFNETITYIASVLVSLLGFSGWERDLDFNPIAVYNRSDDNYNKYYQDVIMVSSISTDRVITLSFNLCRKFKEIERLINEYIK
jgi:hypothetical protein